MVRLIEIAQELCSMQIGERRTVCGLAVLKEWDRRGGAKYRIQGRPLHLKTNPAAEFIGKHVREMAE